jgi:hypothetical protein
MLGFLSMVILILWKVLNKRVTFHYVYYVLNTPLANIYNMDHRDQKEEHEIWADDFLLVLYIPLTITSNI